MSSLAKIAISSLPLIGSVIIGYFLYRSIPTSVMLIVLLLIIFFGVVTSLITYKKLKLKKSANLLEIDENFFPDLEKELIYITPADFSSKAEIGKGKLWLVGIDQSLSLKMEKVAFNKLVDEMTIYFESGYKATITELTTVAFGDVQFQIFGFNTLQFEKNNKMLIEIKWTEAGPELIKNKEVNYRVNMPSRFPILLFERQ